MTTMNVSLPEAMKSWAEQQTRFGRYSNISDYIRDQDRAAQIARMQTLVNAGLQSGPGARSMDELLAVAQQRAAQS